MHKSVSRNLKLFYLYTFLSRADVKRGIFILYWLENGLTNVDVGILQTVLFWGNVIFEIPTGLIADRFSRRTNLIAGCLLRSAIGFGYLCFHTFTPFVFLALISGLSFAFFSGTDQAYLYETLKVGDREEDYAKYQSRAKAISSISLGIAIIAGGYLQALSWHHVFTVFIVLMLLGALAAAFLQDPPRSDEGENGEVVNPWKEIKIFFKSRLGKRLAILIAGFSIYEAAYTPYFIFSQSLFHSFDVGAKGTSFILAGVELATAFSYTFIYRLVGRYSFQGLVAFICPLTVILLLLNLLNNVYLATVAFVLAMIIPPAMLLAGETYVQAQIPTKIRATYFSVHSFFESIFISFSYLLLGTLMDRIPGNQAIATLSIYPILALILLATYFRIRNSSTEVHA